VSKQIDQALNDLHDVVERGLWPNDTQDRAAEVQEIGLCLQVTRRTSDDGEQLFALAAFNRMNSMSAAKAGINKR
jgi:hypothetical protein